MGSFRALFPTGVDKIYPRGLVRPTAFRILFFNKISCQSLEIEIRYGHIWIPSSWKRDPMTTQGSVPPRIAEYLLPPLDRTWPLRLTRFCHSLEGTRPVSLLSPELNTHAREPVKTHGEVSPFKVGSISVPTLPMCYQMVQIKKKPFSEKSNHAVFQSSNREMHSILKLQLSIKSWNLQMPPGILRCLPENLLN